MIEVETPGDLAAHVGQSLGQSHWVEITQAMIDTFAALTGDDHWIHVDTERARTDMPDGKTIAHGLMVVSLIPRLQRDCYRIRVRGRGLNYGYDRMRFTAPIQVGARVRLAMTLEEVETVAKGTRIVTTQTIEIEGQDRPAIVTRHLLLIMDH